MAVDLDPRGPPQPEPDGWELDLERVGLVRRVLLARRYYRADWWFVTIASVMVFGFMVLALAPGVFAPNEPTEQVGPPLLAPGAVPDEEILLFRVDSGYTGLIDFAGLGRVGTGVVRGAASSQAVRDEADRLTGELAAGGSEERVRLDIERYDALAEALDALTGGEVEAVAASSVAFAGVQGDYPDIEVSGPIVPSHGSGRSFLMGTNNIGQDVFSRVIWGTRISLIIGFSASIASLVIGVPLGLLAGFIGGWLDRTLTVIMDSLYAFPGLLLAIAITAVLGPSIFNIIVAIAVLYIPTYYRIVRGQTLSTKESLFVDAARSIGAKVGVILRRYVFPNVIPSVAIIFSVNVADAILTGAGLSFLGLGLPPTTPDWGIDIARGIDSMQNAWWIITFPGVAVMLVVLAFTLLGEGLTEIFNPKLRER